MRVIVARALIAERRMTTAAPCTNRRGCRSPLARPSGAARGAARAGAVRPRAASGGGAGAAPQGRKICAEAPDEAAASSGASSIVGLRIGPASRASRASRAVASRALDPGPNRGQGRGRRVSGVVDPHRGARGADHPRPAGGAERAQLRDGAAPSRRRSTPGRDDPAVALVLIDAEGTRAFCAGGDVQEIYATGRRGDFVFARRFWARRVPAEREDRALSQALRGADAGLRHGRRRRHRRRTAATGWSARAPGSPCRNAASGWCRTSAAARLLARAPGQLGEYLGLTGHRMGPGDAIRAGFADHLRARGGLAGAGRASWSRPATPAAIAARAARPRRRRSRRSARRIDDAFPRPTSPRWPRGSRRATGATGCCSTLGAPLAALDGLHAGAGARRPPRAGHRDGARARVPLHLARDQRRRPARRHPGGGDRQGPQPGLARRHGRACAPEDVAAMLAPLGPDELVLPAPPA